jgi:NADPH:quinone reductase-like Zn-dependent oxidoreductase
MKQTQTIPETFLGVGYTRGRAGLPLEAVRVPVPQPVADQVLIRVAVSSLNPLEYRLADLNFMGRKPDGRQNGAQESASAAAPVAARAVAAQAVDPDDIPF